MKKLNPLMFLPGAVFWALVIAGFATKNDTLLGIAAVVVIATLLVAAVVKLRQSSAEKAERRRIFCEGRPTTARVLTIGTKGGGVNDHPMIDFELEVDGEGDEPPYKVVTSALISQLAIPRVQPGAEIKVYVDPADRSEVVVDEGLTPYGYG